MIDAYQLRQGSDNILGHFLQQPRLVRDRAAIPEDDSRSLMIEARVRSGDYFLTLATELDQLAQQLPAEVSLEIERTINELLYVNKKYQVTRKP